MRLTFRASYYLPAAGVLLLAIALRGMWLTADPPVQSVGIVFHDEGTWVHNARNAVLWDTWRTDAWNPVFVAPVFTALEYVTFEWLGVGTWQARVVPAASGVLALVFFMAGLRALGAGRAALAGGLLLATEYTWVMWNRAALMESTMTALIVVAWAAYARSGRRPIWGAVAGVAATLAFFTKAAAAFFVAAIAIDALCTLALARWPRVRARFGAAMAPRIDERAAMWTLAGLLLSAGIIAAAFVLPYWADYQFFNWQMAVARKPTYTVESFVDRATWLPIVQDFFTRMWPLFAVAMLALAGVVSRWFTARPAERLLVLWMLIGLLELVVHDAGNERRYVMFIPAVIALASLVIANGSFGLAERTAAFARGLRGAALPLILFLGFLVAGSALRPLFGDDVAAGDYRLIVRSSAAVAAIVALALLAFWPRVTASLAMLRVPAGIRAAIVAVMVAWNLLQFGRWASTRGDLNYRASQAVGAQLPPGTTVHGKLANGLALENQIRPVFVGREFGNYEDRLVRDDVRYILTYELPRTGYESQPGLIQEILERYPERRVIATFDVDETPGRDTAVLILKQPGTPAAATGLHRARD